MDDSCADLCQYRTIDINMDGFILEISDNSNETCPCPWTILPHPKKGLRVDMIDVYTSSKNLYIYQKSSYNGLNISYHPKTFAYNVHRYDHKYFQTPPNTGISFQVDYEGQEERAQIRFDRQWNTEESCSQSLIEISEKRQSIEIPGKVDVPCFHMMRYFKQWDNQTEQFLLIFENLEESKVDIYDRFNKLQQTIENDTAFLIKSDHFDFEISSKTNKFPFKRPAIFVQFVGKKCNCNDENVKIPKNGFLELNSPGYPDIYCPSLSCKTSLIAADPTNDTNMVDILHFSAEIKLHDDDIFNISGSNNTYYVSKTGPTISIMEFVTNYENSSICYHTKDNSRKKYYAMNVTHITVPKECYCNVYKEKTISKSFKLETFSMKISSKCDFVYCSWHFKYHPHGDEELITITEFSVKNANKHDKMEIITENGTEIFQNEDFKYRRFYSTQYEFLQLLFTRDARGTVVEEDTEFSFHWDWGTRPRCSYRVEFDLTTTPIVIANYGYPYNYANHEKCTYLFLAPENHTIHVLIDEIQLEPYYDKIQFYQGDHTDTIFKSFTGSHRNVEFYMESKEMVVEFTSDESDVGKGFHINLVAVKNDMTTTSIPNTVSTTKIASASSLSYLWIISLGLNIILFAGF